ncbi:hypothetical protein HDU97_008718 [Phlyctochytrium planicorne]|nr:hypothetical protein HDU97_008718 [Phlyctochytrium planicorne]
METYMDALKHVPGSVLEKLGDWETHEAVHGALERNVAYVKEDGAVMGIITLKGLKDAMLDVEIESESNQTDLINKVTKFINFVLSTVCKHGGDVLGLRGDAVMVLFPRGTGGKEELVGRIAGVFRDIEAMPKLRLMASSLLGGEDGSGLETVRRNRAAELNTTTRAAKNNAIEPAPMFHEIKASGIFVWNGVSSVIVGNPSQNLDFTTIFPTMDQVHRVSEDLKPGEVAIEKDMISESLPFCTSTRKEMGNFYVFESLGQTGSNLPNPTLPTSSNRPPQHDNPKISWQKFVKTEKGISALKLSKEIWTSQDSGSALGREPSPFDSCIPSQWVESNGDGDSFKHRKVTLMVMNLMWSFDEATSQECISRFIGSLNNHCGIYDQTTISDKHQTVVGIFGLKSVPSGQTVSELAVKCALEILWTLSKFQFGAISIAVTTGRCLFLNFDSETRAISSYYGDIQRVAVNLLKLADNAVLCDNDTHNEAAGVGIHEKVGYELSRKKQEEVPMWKILNQYTNGMEDGPGSLDRKETAGARLAAFGYGNERNVLGNGIQKWLKDGERMLAIVEGPSGSGKSSLVNFMKSEASAKGVAFCLSTCSDIEQRTPYIGIQAFVSHIISRQIADNAEKMNVKLRTDLSRGSMASARASSRNLTLSQNPEESVDTLKALASLGVELDLIPLFKAILPGFQVPDSERVSKLDGESRVSLLKALLFAIMQSYASDSCPSKQTVFVVDDAQWIDSTSLEVLYSVLKTGTPICLLFFSRPLADYNQPFMQKTLAIPNAIHIFLNGLSPSESEQLLVWHLREKGVARINQQLLAAIFEVTSGSPLFLHVIAESLMEKIPSMVHAIKGELKPKSDAGIKSILVTDLSLGIKAQFESLNEEFKVLLQQASVFGQTFDLRQVVEAYGLDRLIYDFTDWFAVYDVYRFLIPIDGSEVETTETESRSVCYQYYFRHISIMNCIYDTIEDAKRRSYHDKVGSFYNSIISEGNISIIMPLVSYHFGRGADVKKALSYLEKWGMLLDQNFMLEESIQVFEQLILIVEGIKSSFQIVDKSKKPAKQPNQVDPIARISERQALGAAHRNFFPKVTPGDLRSLNNYFSPLKKAMWFSYLSKSYSTRKMVEESQLIGVACLQILNVTWPMEERQAIHQCVISFIKHRMRWRRTHGGKIKTRQLTPSVLESKQIEYRVLAGLREALFWDARSSKAHLLLSMILTMDSSLELINISPEDFACECFKMMILFNQVYKPLEEPYRARAKEMENQSESVKDVLESQYIIAALSDYPGGKFQEVIVSLDRYIPNKIGNGDFSGEYIGYCLLSHVLFWTDSPRHEETIHTLINKYQDVVRMEIIACMVGGSYIIGRYYALCGNLAAAQPWINSADESRLKLPGKVMKTTFILPRIIECIDNRNLAASISIFSQVAEGLSELAMLLPGPTEALVLSVVLGILILHPPKSWDEKRQPLQPPQMASILEGFQNLKTGAKKTKKWIVYAFWAFELATAVCAYIGKSTRNYSAFNRLKKLVNVGKHAELLSRGVTLRACIYAVIGVCESKSDERKRYLTSAIEVFHKTKLLFLRDWLNSIV